MARTKNPDAKTRNIPQLTKDVRRLNALKARRAKVADLDAEIALLGANIAAQLGLAPASIDYDDDNADIRDAA